jgi:hypothetical protein
MAPMSFVSSLMNSGGMATMPSFTSCSWPSMGLIS